MGNYTALELARALHDHANYPFPMPAKVSFRRLRRKARKAFIQKANELLVIMNGYRKNG